MRDSLTILDQISSFSADINEAEVKDLLGIADIGMLSEISMAVIDGDREKIIGIIAELVDKGTDLKSFAKDLVGFFRDLLVAKIVRKPEEALELAEEEIKMILRILPKASSDMLTLMLSEIVKTESDVRTAFSPRLSLEMSLIRASFLSTLKPIKEAIENIDALIGKVQPSAVSNQQSEISKPDNMQGEKDAPEQVGAGSPAGMTKKASFPLAGNPSSPNDAQTPTALDGTSLLDAILKKIEDPRITSRLSKAMPALKDNILTLTFNSNEAEIFAEPVKKNSSLIESLASGIRNNPTKIEIDVKIKKVIRKKDLEDKALANPAVKEAIELFDGRIVDVKPKENTGG